MAMMTKVVDQTMTDNMGYNDKSFILFQSLNGGHAGALS